MYEVYEKLCKEHGVTTKDVCMATGIGYSTISNWKKRRNLLSARYAILIADYFGVTVDYLMTGDAEKKDYVIPADRVAADLVSIIDDNPVIIEMIYDFADIKEEEFMRLRGYYDAIKRSERRAKDADATTNGDGV